MPKLDSSTQTQFPTISDHEPLRETRFDPPHELARGDDSVQDLSEEPGMAPAKPVTAEQHQSAQATALQSVEAVFATMARDSGADQFSAASAQQFHIHAVQLAEHLDGRQRELDRREAELHARLAQHESSARNSRLWFQERHHDLLDRQSQLEQHEQQLAARLVEFDKRLEAENSASQASLNVHQAEAGVLAERRDELTVLEFDLQQRQSAVDELAARVAQRSDLCDQQELKVQQQEDSLAASEALLARGLIELNEERRLFEEEQTEVRRRREEQQQGFVEKQRRCEIDLEKQKEVLTARFQQLEHRGAALDQLREELVRLQREALEMRLATEELWAELSGLVPPAVITQSLARLRAKLAANYRLQSTDVAQQRKETEELATGVSQQHERLVSQKREFESWIAAQRREIEHQAAQLVAREQELESQQLQIHHLRSQWDGERHRLESESRRLQSELRRKISNSAALA
jgi:DNA repair exonuclease SbcCD ATPase subunit